MPLQMDRTVRAVPRVPWVSVGHPVSASVDNADPAIAHEAQASGPNEWDMIRRWDSLEGIV